MIEHEIKMPCGGIAYFDVDAGYGHRCWVCMAVVGSIGMSQHCRKEMEKWDLMEKLGGKGWDYTGEDA